MVFCIYGSAGGEISCSMTLLRRLPLYWADQGPGDHAGQQALSLGSGFPGDDSAGGAPPADATSPPPAAASPPASPSPSTSPSPAASTSPAAAPTPVPAPAPGPAASSAPRTCLHPWQLMTYKLECCPCTILIGRRYSALLQRPCIALADRHIICAFGDRGGEFLCFGK